MAGTLTIERGTLYDFLALVTRNLRFAKPKRVWPWRRWRPNPRAAARCNVAYHYDLSGELYRLFLDSDRQYSCAYFANGTDVEAELEDAQLAKLDIICRKLRLRPGDRLLDVGCGWGALIMHATRSYGVTALGITLSALPLSPRHVTLLDLTGRQLRESTLTDLYTELDLQGLPGALYILSLTDGKQWVRSIRVVKQ